MTAKDINIKDCALWYESLAGQQALLSLDDYISEYLSEIFGYYCLNIGVLSGRKEFLKDSRISAGFSIGADDNCNDLIAKPEQLPIAADNVDLVIASHVLECSQNPHQVLREIDRVLVPEGHCILIGFNPYTSLGVKRFLKSSRKKDTRYRTRSASHVRDWFSLLGFETLEVNYIGFRPSLKNEKIFKSMAWMEKWGEKIWPLLGSLYIIHAKKQVVSMRPHKKVWKAPILLTGGKVALNRTAQRVRRTNFSN
ncbi:MAG TPA: class I SAM-dependent methyltransferase [Leucothrix mucor]|nr:class I SAM-dependent methyltransferase [Leucothrix mucor]